VQPKRLTITVNFLQFSGVNAIDSRGFDIRDVHEDSFAQDGENHSTDSRIAFLVNSPYSDFS
jgi:hypothetical protein